jgi:excisionase family DNA binding protein
MNLNNSLLTTRDAAQLAGYSPRHIQNMIHKGRLSATRDDGGNYLIEKSEFFRVFPAAHNVRTEEKDDDSTARTMLEIEVEHLKQMLSEKNKQNEFLHKQLELCIAEKAQILDTLSSNQKLLEYSSIKERKKIFGVF